MRERRAGSHGCCVYVVSVASGRAGVTTCVGEVCGVACFYTLSPLLSPLKPPPAPAPWTAAARRASRPAPGTRGTRRRGGRRRRARAQSPQAPPRGRNGSFIVQADLGERFKRVRRQDFRPRVRVVARAVAAGEDVGKPRQKAVGRQGRDDGRRGVDRVQGARPVHAARGRGVVVGVEEEVGRRKVDLAQGHRPRAERARGEQALKHVVRQRFPRVHVAGERVQGALVIAKVFHELGREFDRVPLDAADAGDQALCLLTQHVLRGVPKLVEQGPHLAERHQRGFVSHRGGLVAHHVGDGQADGLAGGGTDSRPPDDFIHPGAPPSFQLGGSMGRGKTRQRERRRVSP